MPTKQEVSYHIQHLCHLISGQQSDQQTSVKVKAYIDLLASSGYDTKTILGIIQGATEAGEDNPNSPIRMALVYQKPLAWDVLYAMGGASQFTKPFCHGSSHTYEAIDALMSLHQTAFTGRALIPVLTSADSAPNSLAASPATGPLPLANTTVAFSMVAAAAAVVTSTLHTTAPARWYTGSSPDGSDSDPRPRGTYTISAYGDNDLTYRDGARTPEVNYGSPDSYGSRGGSAYRDCRITTPS